MRHLLREMPVQRDHEGLGVYNACHGETNVPNVTVDGKTVRVAKEATLLDAARKAGVWIPTLCHNEAISKPATCRICMVEVVRGKGESRMVTACNYPIRDDTIAKVSSERAVKARRGVMELLLARCPDSPELARMATRMGITGTPYPKVTESQRNCILCGLCTTVCEEVIGASAISFAGRGVLRAVAPPFRLASEDCIACGACAAVCPVGTIQVRVHMGEGEIEISPFKSRVKLRLCEECGNRLVTEPVIAKVEEAVRIDWDEFRRRARLCPECRRKRAAESIALVESKKTADSGSAQTIRSPQ